MMSKQASIVFVEQFYYPEGWGGAQIPLDITTALAQAGMGVTVICGRDQYVPAVSRELTDPRDFGVKIRYVPRYLLRRETWKGTMAQIGFCVAASAMLFRRRPSIVVVQTNPPLIVVAMSLSASLLRCPLVIIAQDLYPEVMVAHGMIGERSLRGRFLTRIFGLAYRRATAVVSLGPRMTSRLLQKRVALTRICEISNWATGGLGLVTGSANCFRRDWGLTGKFVLLYSGNMGVAHDVDTVLRAIGAARGELSNLRLVVVGQGGRIAQAEQLSLELGIVELVQFRPLVSAELLPQTLGIADIALVSLRPGFEGLVVPSKLLGHMARGVPTLYVGPRDGDVAQLIDKSGGGLNITNGDVAGMAGLLVELAHDPRRLREMGESAQRYYESHLSRANGLRHYENLINRVLVEVNGNLGRGSR